MPGKIKHRCHHIDLDGSRCKSIFTNRLEGFFNLVLIVTWLCNKHYKH